MKMSGKNNRINNIKRVKVSKLIRTAVEEQKNPKRIMRFFKYCLMARSKGVVDFRWERIASEYCYDDFEFPDVNQKTKDYFHARGYTTNKISWFGMNKENMDDYLSDFELYNVKAYVNPRVYWFDDKLNTYYLLKNFDSNIPKHYYWLDGQKAYPLDSVENRVVAKGDAVRQLLEKKDIAAKACKGGHGAGFLKLSKKDGKYFINNVETTEEHLNETIKALSNYIITDYIYPHKDFVKLCGDDAYTVIRVLAVFDPDDGPQITSMNIRLGCKAAGVVTGYAGCIYAGVDLETGEIFKPLYRPFDHEYKHVPCEFHPDTGLKIEGTVVPNYDKLKELVKAISAYMPFSPYLMMDIIPSDEEFYVLEINSHGQPITMEPYYPFKKNKYNKKVFHID